MLLLRLLRLLLAAFDMRRSRLFERWRITDGLPRETGEASLYARRCTASELEELQELRRLAKSVTKLAKKDAWLSFPASGMCGKLVVDSGTMSS